MISLHQLKKLLFYFIVLLCSLKSNEAKALATSHIANINISTNKIPAFIKDSFTTIEEFSFVLDDDETNNEDCNENSIVKHKHDVTNSLLKFYIAQHCKKIFFKRKTFPNQLPIFILFRTLRI